MTIIRINDRRDPGMPTFELTGATIETDNPDSGTVDFTVTIDSEFASRLMHTPDPVRRFNVAIDEDPVWYGVVETYRPAGARLLVTARPARSIEEGII